MILDKIKKFFTGEEKLIDYREDFRVYNTGGGWGNAIDWCDEKRFENEDLTNHTRLKVVGWKDEKPRVGDKLIGEMKKSHIHFVFTDITHCGNPPDMFFAYVQPRKQIPKV